MLSAIVLNLIYCVISKEANMRGDVPTVSLPTWMNSDRVRAVGVKPNPAGYLGSMSLIKHLDFIGQCLANTCQGACPQEPKR